MQMNLLFMLFLVGSFIFTQFASFHMFWLLKLRNFVIFLHFGRCGTSKGRKFTSGRPFHTISLCTYMFLHVIFLIIQSDFNNYRHLMGVTRIGNFSHKVRIRTLFLSNYQIKLVGCVVNVKCVDVLFRVLEKWYKSSYFFVQFVERWFWYNCILKAFKQEKLIIVLWSKKPHPNPNPNWIVTMKILRTLFITMRI